MRRRSGGVLLVLGVLLSLEAYGSRQRGCALSQHSFGIDDDVRSKKPVCQVHVSQPFQNGSTKGRVAKWTTRFQRAVKIANENERKKALVSKKTTSPIDKHIGNRVRMRRLMLHMSQTTLGDALGVSCQQVQRYEQGTNRIGASRLKHISSVLQVPVGFFFEGTPQMSAIREWREPLLTEFMATRHGLALAKAFMRIGNVQLRRCIVDLVEKIERNRN
jgi:transcriptional regulator with XRE-family HTH domain